MDEAPLILWNDFRENMLQPIRNYFGDQFIASVAKRYGTKSIEGVGALLLGDECKEHGICASSNFLTGLRFLDHFIKIFSHNVPAGMEKSGGETIRTWGFIWVHGKESAFDLVHGDFGF